MNDHELIARWRPEPFPLLPLLHAFHERDGSLTEAALRAIAEGLKLPLAELYGTATFYHHLSREPGGQGAPRVCTGPICRLRGAEGQLERLEGHGAKAMPCSGRCDQPVPILVGRRTMTLGATSLQPAPPSPMPGPANEPTRECVFASIREPGRSQLDGYLRTGGFAGLKRALQMSPEAVRDLVAASGLSGRGGAAFPTARKWQAVFEAPGTPKSVVCNADEGEPGCFKDRALMDHDPFALIEGMAICAHATGATRGVIYLRYEYPETEAILEEALKAARAAGYLGKNFAGAEADFDILLRVGAGAYICGEETSLLNSLEGRHPFPRNRPPYPVTHGLEDLPTAVQNVETLCSVGPILARGADWYRGLGLHGHAGTKIISLSGDVQRPGNYEVPMGLPLATLLYDWAGGPAREHPILAVTMAGLSGGFLGGRSLDVTLDEPSLRAQGSFLGAGGVMVFDAGRNLVDIARGAMEFFAHESCGKCFPCRIGTNRLLERLQEEPLEMSEKAWRDEVRDLSLTMRQTSACGLGQAAPLIVESLLKHFEPQVAAKAPWSQR